MGRSWIFSLQWDALPDAAKWQIILFVGFLEWFSESAGTHYMRGGVPGKFENFSDHKELVPHPVPFNLYDPFGLSRNKKPEKVSLESRTCAAKRLPF